MDNTNNINNDEIKPKKVYYEAQKNLQANITNKIMILKNINKEIEIKEKEHMKKTKNILSRVRANQRHNQEIEPLERLLELKEQGLITFEKTTLKDNHELLNNLEILGMSCTIFTLIR
jgi:hypothetical protein